MLPAQFGPNGIELVGKPVRGLGSLDVVRQIETAQVYNRSFSDQIEMIPAFKVNAAATPSFPAAANAVVI
jgi:hypothetical protein